MAGKNPKAATDSFLRRFGDALKCIADFHITASHSTEHNNLVFLRPFSGEYRGKQGAALPLIGASGDIDFYLDVTMSFQITKATNLLGPYKCQTTGYSYILSDADEHELLVFQWAPLESFSRPHLHVTAAGCLDLKDGYGIARSHNLSNFHLPTGRVLIEDVVELLIEEFKVETTTREWKDLLEGNRDAFEVSARWGTYWRH